MLYRVQSRLIPLIRRLRRAATAEIQAWAAASPVLPRTVLYESFAGNGALDNPEALFRELLRSPDFSDLHHIWVLDRSQTHARIRAEFKDDRRVSFVEYRSAQYSRALATSGYLVNNATFPPEFAKRPGQIYLNMWHGTPLKRMGYDMPNGAFDSANTLRNFVAADFLLSQNPFMSERMYENAYKLRGVFRGQIIEAGYPRVDRQFLDRAGLLAAREQLDAAGIAVRDRKIVLYAPTWKGNSFSQPHDDVATLLAAVTQLQSQLGETDYVVVVKTHQVVHKFAATNPLLRQVLVPNDIPTNTVLGVADILITDYSSIFFDFLATDRPIVFYTPDTTDYSGSRGTYFEPTELPGPVFTELAQVAAAIAAGLTTEAGAPSNPRYAEWKSRFTAHDDGHAASRIVDLVFRNHEGHRSGLTLLDDSRTSVLLHLGGMHSNGITSSAINLLNAIDHSRYDVSIVIRQPRGKQQLANQAKIPPQVRQFHRIAGMNGHKSAHLLRKMAEWRANPDHHRTPSVAALWDAEWRRCFGDVRFDVVIDFSGYSPFWASLFLHSPPALRLIWLHNDMAAEQHRLIGGRPRMRRSLRTVFALYPQFDRLVSVSQSLAELNSKNLRATYDIAPDAFVATRNQIDATGIRERLQQDLRTAALLVDDEGGSTEPEWATLLGAPGDPQASVARPSEQRLCWFVSVGRYSTEKNQALLIRAFALVHSQHAESRLLLVGYGPLQSELEKQISELNLTSAVFLTGPLANPFPVMAAADCFVLSSSYEGQPMVLLEAAVVGLPIVSVAFDSIRDALPRGEIHIVAADESSLAQGMNDFLAGAVKAASLDAKKYNADSLGTLDAILAKHP